MKKRRMLEPEKGKEEYIAVIDYARFDNLRLYGIGIISREDLELLKNIQLEYFGNLPSKIKRKKVVDFRKRIRGLEKHMDLLASTKLEMIFNLFEEYSKKGIIKAVVDPKVWKAFSSRFSEKMSLGSVRALQENKHALRRSRETLLANFLNIVDAFIRWARNVFKNNRATRFVRIKRGTLRKK